MAYRSPWGRASAPTPCGGPRRLRSPDGHRPRTDLSLMASLPSSPSLRPTVPLQVRGPSRPTRGRLAMEQDEGGRAAFPRQDLSEEDAAGLDRAAQRRVSRTQARARDQLNRELHPGELLPPAMLDVLDGLTRQL